MPGSGAFENNATINVGLGDRGVWVDTGINISTFTNAGNGIINGGSASVYNQGTIGTVDNLGFIFSNANGIENLGSIQTLNNNGTIDVSAYGVKNLGTIESLNNRGFIKGRVTSIRSEGGIGALTNSGTIQATLNSAIWNFTGTIDKIENTATGKIIGRSAGIYNDDIINSIINSGTIEASSYALYSSNKIGTVDNSGIIKSDFTAISIKGTLSNLTNTGNITSNFNSAIYNSGAEIGTIENASGANVFGASAGIYNTSGIAAIINNGTIDSDSYAIYTYGAIGTLTNGGTIVSESFALYNNDGGEITTLDNSGTIKGLQNTAIYNNGTITTLNNSGTIEAGRNYGIYNRTDGEITTLNNSGSIKGAQSTAIHNNGTITTLNNSGTIQADESYAIYNSGGTIETLINTGTINGVTSDAIYNSSGTITTLTNEGKIISGEETGIYNAGLIGTLNNSGEITAAYTGIYNDTESEIATLINTGSITGGASYYGIHNSGGGIENLVNRGTISGDEIDILNDGGILNLTNGQGGTAAGSALTLSGALPQGEYIAHITSPTQYGQLLYVDGAGALNSFALTADSKLEKGTYQDVLAGIDEIGGELTGTLGRMLWTLTADADQEGVWDLVVELLGPDAAKTLLALGYSRDEVLTALRNRAALMNNALATDCGEFGSSGVCLNFSLRRNALAGERETSGTIAASVRLTEQLRVGAFAQLPFNHSSGLVGVKRLDKKAIFGGFVGYSQQAGGAGLQARISAATNSSDLSIARPFEQDETEGGTGTTTVKSWGMGAELGYGFAVGGETLVTPYLGLQHISVTRKGYTEAASDTVEFPLTYADYGQRNTTARTGVVLASKVASKVLFRIGGGLDFDLSSKSDAYAGTSTIEDMTTFSLNNTIGAKKVRANGMVELGYEVMPGMAITAAASVRGEAFSDKANSNLSIGLRFGF